MKKLGIYEIKGGEILANPVITSGYQILLSEGTVLQKEYVQNLNDLGIREVYVWEEKERGDSSEKTNKSHELAVKCRKEIRNVLENHIYQDNRDLHKLKETAAIIIEDLLNEENITEKMLEMKERTADIYEHSLSCCMLSIILSLKLNFKPDVIHSIGIGCLLHDMGLRYISAKYNNIDLESMPENQKSEYKKHTVYGYSSIENENWLSDISKDIILYHHERLDGTGYPFLEKGLQKKSVLSVSVILLMK